MLCIVPSSSTTFTLTRHQTFQHCYFLIKCVWHCFSCTLHNKSFCWFRYFLIFPTLVLVVQKTKQDVMVSPTIKLTLCVFGYKYISGMSVAVAAMKNNTAQWSMFLTTMISSIFCTQKNFLPVSMGSLRQQLLKTVCLIFHFKSFSCSSQTAMDPTQTYKVLLL